MKLDLEKINNIIDSIWDDNIDEQLDISNINIIDQTHDVIFKKIITILWISENLISPEEKDEVIKKINYKSEILKYKLIIEEHKGVLKDEANIIFKNWIWYFWDAKGSQVWKKFFRTFLKSKFNKCYWLWDNRWYIECIWNLKKLFICLWFNVATEEEEIIRWKEKIESKKKILEKESNIIFKNWIWYFWDAKGSQVWKKYFRTFLKSKFNKCHWIWNDRWFIENIWNLKKLFICLWFNVATEEEEIIRWKEKIESYKNILRKKSNIIFDNWIWYFWNTKNHIFLKKLFRSFPNSKFNKKYGLGNARWFIENIRDLENLFIFLWFNIVHDDYKKTIKKKTFIQK